MMNNRQYKNKRSHEVLHQAGFFMNKSLCRKHQANLNKFLDSVIREQNFAIFAVFITNSYYYSYTKSPK